MKTVPFVANSSDNLHCVPAVFRMISQYYFGQDLSWDEIDKILNVVPGKGVWSMSALTYFAKKGLNITNIEPISYQELYKKGPKYLYEVVGKDNADYNLNKSNIMEIIPLIPDFLKTVKQEVRRSSIDEIIENLEQDKLVAVEVNSRILNNRDGFNLHFILLYDFDGKNIIFHDPGLSPIEGRKISLEDFKKAFAYPGSNGGIAIFSE